MRILRLIVVAIVLAACSACGTTRPSSLHSDFSLQEIIERNKGQFGLDCSGGGVGGGTSIGEVSGFGQKSYESSRHVNFSCSQQSGVNLGHSALMAALQKRVGEIIQNSGARIVDQGTSAGVPWSELYTADSGFSFRYKLENAEGRMRVSATRMGGQVQFNTELEEHGP